MVGCIPSRVRIRVNLRVWQVRMLLWGPGLASSMLYLLNALWTVVTSYGLLSVVLVVLIVLLGNMHTFCVKFRRVDPRSRVILTLLGLLCSRMMAVVGWAVGGAYRLLQMIVCVCLSSRGGTLTRGFW